MVERVGFARGSRSRRRAREAWAPARQIFLLKNPPPAFESHLSNKKQKGIFFLLSRRGGIRTHGPLRAAAFQVRWNKPLSDPSMMGFIIATISTFYTFVDLRRIGLLPARCHRAVLPLNYRPPDNNSPTIFNSL